MSDEALVREREPIERVRARLEALVRANAAPRCGARSKRTGKPCRAAARPNGRGKGHGGKGSGAGKAGGLGRRRGSNLKPGFFSWEAEAGRAGGGWGILFVRYLRKVGYLDRGFRPRGAAGGAPRLEDVLTSRS